MALKVKIVLGAAVNSVRLVRRVKESLKTPLEVVRYFTDSLAVLGLLRTESGKFNEFMGASYCKGP